MSTLWSVEWVVAVERLSRQEQRERNRLALLEAAEKVFAERGIQGASVDEVAAEAGLTKGAVYSNFDGKEDLLLAVLRHGLGREARAQAERLLHGGREAGALVEEFGAYWVESARGGGQDRFARLTVEFMVHATRHPAVREQLVALLFPGEGAGSGPHPLAPVGSGLAELPYEEADAILKSLDLGMRLLTLLAPEHCPPELFLKALRLLAAPKPAGLADGPGDGLADGVAGGAAGEAADGAAGGAPGGVAGGAGSG
ncbi:helix-turn-helix domain-containing protein [Nonomuraea sp. NPDC050202]|uniref:TetR/AcrR family transcriptional regulator n=1 Tax=Nonomuraea sp. NPDC050202 TaxID=3155035 RepID=UPI00340F82F0